MGRPVQSEFERDGYYVLRGVLTEEEVDRLRDVDRPSVVFQIVRAGDSRFVAVPLG